MRYRADRVEKEFLMFAHIRHALSSSTISLWSVCLMALLPFILPTHQHFISQFYQEWFALLFGVFALYPLLNKINWQNFAIPQVAFMFLGFGLIVLVQSILGILHSTQNGLLLLAYFLSATLIAVLGGYLRRELGWQKLVTALAWAILVGGLLNVAYVLLQLFSTLVVALPFISKNSNLGLMANLSHFANYMALAVASLLYLYAKSHLKLGVFLILLVLMLTVLSITMLTVAWWYLALLTLLAIGLQINAIRERTGSKNKRSLVRVALLMLPLLLVAQYVLPWLAITTPPTVETSAVVTNDWAVRLHLWQESLQLFLRSPWLGIGLGQTHWMSFMTLDAQWSVNLPGAYQNARNIVLQVLSEMGLAGFLMLLAGVVAWVRAFQWKNLDLEAWWLLAVLLLILTSSLIEANLSHAYFLMLTAFLIGAGDEKTKHIRLTHQGVLASRSMLIGLVGLCLFALFNVLVANIKLENAALAHRSKGLSSEYKADIKQGLSWVKSHSLLSAYADVAYAESQAPNHTNVEDKIMINAAALRQMPTQQTAYRHVLFLEFNGEHEQAVAYMQRGVQAYPHQFKAELQTMPLQYWDMYLRTFSEAISTKANRQ